MLDKDVAGKEASEAFFGLHKSEVLEKYKRLAIGTIENEYAQTNRHLYTLTLCVRKPKYVILKKGELSTVPHAEPAWLSKGYYSPYYSDSHRALQKYMRQFTDDFVTPDAKIKEETGQRPDVKLIEKCGELNINAMRLGPGKHLHGLTLPTGLKGENFDYFHELVVTQEFSRIGARGYADGFQGGMVIGLPPVLNFGSEELKKRIVPDVLAGKKFISLAISEAFAGSDVAGLRCVAELSADKTHYIVNGTSERSFRSTSLPAHLGCFSLLRVTEKWITKQVMCSRRRV